MRQIVVRYKVKPEHAAENERLVRGVYEALRELGSTELRYATVKLEDGVSFMHLHESDGDSPLPSLPAFKRFVEGIPERCDEPPVTTEFTEVGSFRFFDRT